jgi:hypothetical protein
MRAAIRQAANVPPEANAATNGLAGAASDPNDVGEVMDAAEDVVAAVEEAAVSAAPALPGRLNDVAPPATVGVGAAVVDGATAPTGACSADVVDAAVAGSAAVPGAEARSWSGIRLTPTASSGMTNCQPGWINLARWRARPSGWIRPWLRAKISW